MVCNTQFQKTMVCWGRPQKDLPTFDNGFHIDLKSEFQNHEINIENLGGVRGAILYYRAPSIVWIWNEWQVVEHVG